MQEKESPKIAHVKLPSDWVRFKTQFLHTFLSPGFPVLSPRFAVLRVAHPPCVLHSGFRIRERKSALIGRSNPTNINKNIAVLIKLVRAKVSSRHAPTTHSRNSLSVQRHP